MNSFTIKVEFVAIKVTFSYKNLYRIRYCFRYHSALNIDHFYQKFPCWNTHETVVHVKDPMYQADWNLDRLLKYLEMDDVCMLDDHNCGLNNCSNHQLGRLLSGSLLNLIRKILSKSFLNQLTL